MPETIYAGFDVSSEDPNFSTKGPCSNRRILCIFFQVVKEPIGYLSYLLVRVVELCTGAGLPKLRYILLEPELENSSKNPGRQNYEKFKS